MKNLIIDTHNLITIIRFGLKNTELLTDEEWSSYLLDQTLVSLSRYIATIKPDRVVMVFEGRNSWRKKAYPAYKQHRAKKRDEDPRMPVFYKTIDMLREFLHSYTNIHTAQINGAEGDDVIAILARYLGAQEDVVIVSTDRDFNQLLHLNKVRILDPIKKVYKTKYDEFELFMKCIKGDMGDNVTTSYPGVREEFVKQMFESKSVMENEFENVRTRKQRQLELLMEAFEVEIPEHELTKAEIDEIFAELKALKEELPKPMWKDILKRAKAHGLTEAKLLSHIPDFEVVLERNKKLIILDETTIPEEVVGAILDRFNEDHSATDMDKVLNFVRDNNLREFFFGEPWKILKSIKSH